MINVKWEKGEYFTREEVNAKTQRAQRTRSFYSRDSRKKVTADFFTRLEEKGVGFARNSNEFGV